MFHRAFRAGGSTARRVIRHVRSVSTPAPTLLLISATVLTYNTASFAAAHAFQQPPATSIWDGVYTEAQAARGLATYRRACTYCHLSNLAGGSDAAAPPLAGARFLNKWKDQSLAALFAKMAQTMPMDGTDVGGDPPAAVALEEYLDIVAFVLMSNGAPSGQAELPADERLEPILITEKPR